MLCLSYCNTLGPMLPCCSVIVAAVDLAEVDHRVLRAGRDQPRTVDRHGGVDRLHVEIPDCSMNESKSR